jgi:hypothetical protein
MALEFNGLSLFCFENHGSEAHKPLLIQMPVAGTAGCWRPAVMI